MKAELIEDLNVFRGCSSIAMLARFLSALTLRLLSQ